MNAFMVQEYFWRIGGIAKEKLGLPSFKWPAQQPGPSTLALNKIFQQLQHTDEPFRASPLSPRVFASLMLPSLSLSLVSTHLSGIRQNAPPTPEQSEAPRKKKNYSHSFIEYLLGPGTLLRIYYAFFFKPHKQLEQTGSETLSNLSKDTQLESDN